MKKCVGSRGCSLSENDDLWFSHPPPETCGTLVDPVFLCLQNLDKNQRLCIKVDVVTVTSPICLWIAV